LFLDPDFGVEFVRIDDTPTPYATYCTSFSLSAPLFFPFLSTGVHKVIRPAAAAAAAASSDSDTERKTGKGKTKGKQGRDTQKYNDCVLAGSIAPNTQTHRGKQKGGKEQKHGKKDKGKGKETRESAAAADSAAAAAAAADDVRSETIRPDRDIQALVAGLGTIKI
jgi:hypothetical protein